MLEIQISLKTRTIFFSYHENSEDRSFPFNSALLKFTVQFLLAKLLNFEYIQKFNENSIDFQNFLNFDSNILF